MMAYVDALDGDSVDSLLSWVDWDEIEVSQTCNADDKLTPDKDDTVLEASVMKEKPE